MNLFVISIFFIFLHLILHWKKVEGLVSPGPPGPQFWRHCQYKKGLTNTKFINFNTMTILVVFLWYQHNSFGVGTQAIRLSLAFSISFSLELPYLSLKVHYKLTLHYHPKNRHWCDKNQTTKEKQRMNLMFTPPKMEQKVWSGMKGLWKYKPSKRNMILHRQYRR